MNQSLNKSNCPESDFLNKAHPILDVSLTGERNNISANAGNNMSTKLTLEPRGTSNGFRVAQNST